MTVRFIMLMPWGRVGSNLLFSILRQSAPMKLANENLIRIPTAEEQRTWFENFYEINEGVASHDFIGSKQNLRSIRDLPAIREMLFNCSARIVRLRRDNLLKAAVSQIRAEAYAKQTQKQCGVGIWALRKGNKPLGPIAIHPNLLLERIEVMKRFHSLLMGLFDEYQVFDIEYEEINCALPRTVERLRTFLSVPTREFSVPYEKATPDDLGAAVLNIDEIHERLTNSPYAGFL